jgi:hypothetical protein
MNRPDFSTCSAQQAAAAGQLEPWIDGYLQGGAWANRGLLEGLQNQSRWWLGPLEVALDRLSRCCGPEPNMEYRVPADAWETHVTALAAGLTEPAALPPLIVMYDNGELSIRDGNHRHEAMRRRGWRTGCPRNNFGQGTCVALAPTKRAGLRPAPTRHCRAKEMRASSDAALPARSAADLPAPNQNRSTIPTLLSTNPERTPE